MATRSSGQVEIEIENEMYSLLSVPEASSAVVQRERKNLSGCIGLDKFAESIEHVGKFIKVAYNGVNAAGPNFVDVQIEVQRLGFDITKLCNESSVTLEKFRATAVTASSELISVYQFLLDGFEDIAIESLDSLSKLAEGMIKIAHDLEEKFKVQAEKVKTTVETTRKEKSKQAIQNKGLEKEQETTEEEKKKYKKLVDRQYKLVEEAKEERIKYEKEEENALKESKLVTLIGVAIAIIPVVGEVAKDVIIQKSIESIERSKRLREIVKEKNEIEQKKEQYYLEGLQKMSEFAAKLQHIKTEEEMAEVAIDALHKAAQPLLVLSLIMEEAVQFWSYIQDHCQRMVTTQIKKNIEMYAPKNEEIKERLWNHPEFIKKGVSYHAQWISLQDLCEKYGKEIEVTRSGLYSFIVENPTYEQSRKHLPELTKEFIDEVNEGKKRITAKIDEKEQQRRALTDFEHN